MKYLLIILIAILTLSCRPTQTISNRVVKDSVITKVVVKHDTIAIKGDEVTIEKQIPCPDQKPFTETKRSGRATITISEDKNGKLTATANCDSLQKIIDHYDTVTQHYHSDIQKETKIVEKAYIPAMFKYSAILLWILVAFAIALWILKIKKVL